MGYTRTPCIALLLILCLAPVAKADVIFDLGILVNGTAASGNPKATFQNMGTDMVQLTLDLSDLPTAEYVDDWVFNIASPPAASLSIVRTGGTGPSTADIVAITQSATTGGTNMKAGIFDFGFTFDTSNSMSGAKRFNGGESLVFKITGTGITENSFVDYSTADGSIPGGYVSAAHVAGIALPGGGTISGSLAAVPEPTSGVATLLSTLGFFIIRRRRSNPDRL